ncbi:hypothetical protein [Mangrovibacterium sp.]|uniref:hypothetical protein n=1 Tax=Mangrovibacterium sp. TaxID=1961364 RepID=UPI003568D08F
MFEYAKVLLPKVSFSQELFRKELRKCLAWLDNDAERQALRQWCKLNFEDQYPEIQFDLFS